MKRHFNTHVEGLDLDYWRSLIESCGSECVLGPGESLCRAGEPTCALGYVPPSISAASAARSAEGKICEP